MLELKQGLDAKGHIMLEMPSGIGNYTKYQGFGSVTFYPGLAHWIHIDTDTTENAIEL